MVVTCDECGLLYRIDPEKIIGQRAKFSCKGCTHSIIVQKEEDADQALLNALDDATLSEASIELGEQAPDDYNVPDEEMAPETGEDLADFTPPVELSLKKRGGIGLTAKIVYLMLIVSLLPGAVYFGLSFKESNERMFSQTNETGAQVSGLLVSEVDEWIDKNTRVLKAYANLPDIVSMNQFQQEVALKTLQSEYPWMYLVFTTDERGLNIARSDDKVLRDYSNTQYVKDVVDGADLAWQNLIGKISKQPALVLTVPIKNGETIVGVLGAEMTRDAISKLVANYKQGATGSSFLVDQVGKTVAHQNNTYVLQQQDMSNHPLVNAAGHGEALGVEFVDANGKETIGFAQKTELGWALAIQQEKTEAFESLKKAQTFAYIFLTVTLLVVIIIGLLAGRAIVQPIRRLTDAANRISIGDLDVEIVNTSKDEISDLADAIARMQDSIRLSISRLKRLKR